MRRAAALLLFAALAQAQLPPWQAGMLDIHQISTGRGNAALLILPDGTTLLVDAGAAGEGLPESEPHPDASRRPGEWIARYVKRHLPAGTSGLDYALITHFHGDHMGGIRDVAAALSIGTLIDRGWPDYAYPAPLADPSYLTWVKDGRRVERFRPGESGQIRMLHGGAWKCEVRNIVGNGDLGGGRRLFPPIEGLATADRPNENMCSLAIRVDYGAFRYFTGGDLPGTPDPGFPAWHAVEAGIASAVGPVDVHVVNQHGSMGEESDAFLAALRSTVLIVPSWAASHPAPDVLKRIMNSRLPPSPRYVFATEMREAAKIVIGQRATQLAGPPGHVVVRVEAGGARYQVYVLSNRDERDEVLASKGPFTAGAKP